MLLCLLYKESVHALEGKGLSLLCSEILSQFLWRGVLDEHLKMTPGLRFDFGKDGEG
jgi:hypothetical protein